MLFNLKNVINTGLSFLSSKKVPPNTPECEVERLRSVNHMESKKFFIVLTSVVILAFFYFASVGILFLIPKGTPEFFTGFVTIFSKTIEILSIIIAAYVGAQAVVDLKYGSQSKASLESTTHHETNENITVIQTNMKEDDYELR
jgi:succinate dehydrogenase hydrophobic anchor subunit